MYPGQQMGYNTSWNPSAGYQTWPGQPADMNAANQAPQINPQTGQADYSAQWADYYRSLGMHREAEMIEQQAKQQQIKPDMNSQGRLNNINDIFTTHFSVKHIFGKKI